MYDDTIAAIATPLGEGGIGIIRISGPRAAEVLSAVFVRRRGKGFPPRQMVYGHVVDPATGTTIDEALAVFMPGPRTYTRQDVAEINCHGGPLPLQRALGAVLAAGARMAEPGEFTLRAFLNGRLDLAQAEAVIDVIRARTSAGLGLAVGQLRGRLSSEVSAIRGEVLAALAYLTATIDFVEDEIPPRDVTTPLRLARERLNALIRNADVGAIFRQGVRIAIVGRPNVGKSSLLNALLGHERAIVTPIPGTTRDTLEETLNLGGIPLVLVDTAGITTTDDVVEQMGVERSRRAIEGANLVLLVLDGSEPLRPYDREIAALVAGRPTVVAVNKSDLTVGLNDAEVDGLLPDAPRVRTSTANGEGLEALERAVRDLVLGGRVVSSDELLVSNPRHEEALRRAQQHLDAALAGLEADASADLLCIDLTAATSALGEITGETVGEDLLEKIFHDFCIGK